MGGWVGEGTDTECQLCYVVGHGIYASQFDLARHRRPFFMSLNQRLPQSDLTRLASDVLEKAPAAALPCNLSDEWLLLIERDLAACSGELVNDESASHMAAPLALIIHLLVGKNRHDAQFVGISDFQRYLEDYRLEICLEMVNRKTSVSTIPATLTTIFENRDISTIKNEVSRARGLEPHSSDVWDDFKKACETSEAPEIFDIPRIIQTPQRDPFED